MAKIAISVELEEAVFNEMNQSGKPSALIAEGIRLALALAMRRRKHGNRKRARMPLASSNDSGGEQEPVWRSGVRGKRTGCVCWPDRHGGIFR